MIILAYRQSNVTTGFGVFFFFEVGRKFLLGHMGWAFATTLPLYLEKIYK